VVHCPVRVNDLVEPVSVQPVSHYMIATATWYGAYGMQSVVFAWLVTIVLREPAERVGWAQTMLLVPSMVLILFAGAIADRVGAARQAMWSQFAAALIPVMLIGALLFFELTYTIMIVYAIVMGTAQAFVTPSRDGLLNQVAQGNVQRTVMQTSLAQFGLQIVGYTIAGFADRLGAEVILAIQSGVLLIGVWGYRQIHVATHAVRPISSFSGGHVFQGIMEGAVTVMSNPIMRVVVLQNVAMAFFFMGTFIVAFPLVVREVFAGSSGDLAILSGFNSLGLVVTILVLLRVGYVQRPGRALLVGQGVGAIALFTTGLVGNFTYFVALVFAWGMCGGIAMPMCRTLMQELAPPEQRSRVMSFFAFSFMGAGPMGALMVGYLAEVFGPQPTILICSAAMLLSIVIVGVATPMWATHFSQSSHVGPEEALA
jgi:MFS family permease